MSNLRCALALYLALLVSLPASAQSALSGRVVDPVGGAVAGATVTLTGAGLPSPQTATTGPDGTFSLAGGTTGTYVLAVDAPGFQRWTKSLDTRALETPLTVELPIPGFSETLAVTAPTLEETVPQALEQVGVRVQTITAAQIENGGYDDATQALQSLVPGLFLTPKAGAFDYVDASFQGSRTNEILWLVDGVRISNRLYNGTTPLDTIPAHMIERIEVVEGGQGLFYGTQAVAGAVNVVTRSFTNTADGRAQAGVDTNRGGHADVFARGALDAHKFVVFASKDQARGYQSFPASQYQTSTTDRNRSYNVGTFGAKYAVAPSSAFSLGATYQLTDARLDNLRPGRSSASQSGGLSAGYNDRTEQIFSAHLDYTPTSTAQLFFKTYYHQWDSHFTEVRNVASRPGTSVVSSDAEYWGFKDYGANLLARLSPSRQIETFIGYDFQNYRGRDEVLLIAPTTEIVHALFGQLRTTDAFSRKATLAFGARVNAPSHSQTATVWNASGRYDLTSTTFVRGTVGTAFRYPDAYELFASDPTCCFGNPNLRPERSTNINGSLGRRFGTRTSNLTLEAIGFVRRVTDLIVDIDDGSGDTTITANRPDVVRVRGLSLVSDAVLGPTVSMSGSYSWNRSQRTNDLAGGYQSLNGIPSNQMNAVLDLHPAHTPFGLSATIKHVGRVTNTVPVFGSVKAGNYTVIDLAGRYFLDSKRRHRIGLRLENLFDATYSTRNGRNFVDGSATPYLVNYLGVPRTLHLSYSFGL